ncbi:hypothetical protein MHZ36_12615 [Staphylococcus sp. ACRSN]|uniref:hypothetical protein n=1 Tax=Staphylococcus sp. ACRSN TaxID=2918214 RepID=UPI001EF17234|nr:hypothetical protein [Staphylococcus sp. ACRSN]MCG7340131.1 hypothetical protein [Staphylococcus sp. ACRSN]
MKDKESNQNYNTPILLLIGVVIAVLIVCYLVIDALIGFKNTKEVIPIIISIFGLFATFGGAYLGAKIAGDNARNIYEKQKEDMFKDELYQIETSISMEFSKILENHNKLNSYAICCDDSYGFEDRYGGLDIKTVLDIYAIPLIALLKKEKIHRIEKELLENIVKVLNDCNRYYNAFKSIDFEKEDRIKSPIILSTNDHFKLSENESDELNDLAREMRSDKHNYKTKYIVSAFILQKMDKRLDKLINNITNEDIKTLFLESKLSSKESSGFTSIYNF